MKHRKTCRRFNDVGHAHFLTFSCYHRQPFLSRDRSRQWMLDAIARAREQYDFHVWAYVIMPEHVHLLIWPARHEYSISAILKSLKQSVARRALTFVNNTAPQFLSRMEDRQPSGAIAYRFWQRGGGFDSNLTQPRAIWEVIEYIHANPVRRRLCVRPTDWRWSSAREMEGPGSGELRLNLESLPRTSAGSRPRMLALLRDASMAPGLRVIRIRQSLTCLAFPPSNRPWIPVTDRSGCRWRWSQSLDSHFPA